MHMRKIFYAVGAATILSFAGYGVASAAIPDSAGVVHGCYANKGGALSVIDTATTSACPKGTTSLNWNQTGQPGPAGATGPPGLAGPSTAGPGGLDTTVVINSLTFDTAVQASCPADHPFVVGGGGEVDNGARPMSASYPGPGVANGGTASSWCVIAAPAQDGSIPSRITAFAICAK